MVALNQLTQSPHQVVVNESDAAIKFDDERRMRLYWERIVGVDNLFAFDMNERQSNGGPRRSIICNAENHLRDITHCRIDVPSLSSIARMLKGRDVISPA